jgi:hypothetical protein
MTKTEKLVQDMSRFMRSLGGEAIRLPEPDDSASELEYLRKVKQVYTQHLLQKMPQYKALKSEALIPDIFLDVLRRREVDLEARTGSARADGASSTQI